MPINKIAKILNKVKETRFGGKTLKELELERSIARNQEVEESMMEGIEAGVGADNPALLAKMQKAVAASNAAQLRDIPRLELKQQARRERQVNSVASEVTRLFAPSTIRGAVSELSRGSDAVNGSMALAEVPYTELEEKQIQYQARLEKLGTIAVNAATLLVREPNSKHAERRQKRFESAVAERDELMGEMATTQAGLRMQEGLGLDPRSKLRALYKNAARIQGLLDQNELSKQIGENSISIKDVEKLRASADGKDVGADTSIKIKRSEIDEQLAQEMHKFVAAFKEMTEASKENTKASKESFEKSRAAAEAHGENIEKLKEAQKITQESGGATNVYAHRAQQLQIASAGFNAAGGAVQDILVNQRMQTMSNQAGFAQLENEKYDTYRKALSGDMTSMMMLKEFSASQDFGGQIFMGQQTANTAKVSAALSEAGSGGMMILAAGSGALQSFVTGGTGANASAAGTGLNMAISGSANALTTGEDFRKALVGPGGSANAAYLAANRARLDAARQVLAVPGFQSQQLFEFSRGMGQVATGMGATQGENFLQRTLGDNGLLDKMQGLNISPQEMAKMMSFGVGNIGSTFTEESALVASGLQRSGMGTREENLQRMAMLTQAGANNPETALSSVLEAAVGKGFDNSKSMTLLVQNTAEMAKQSGAAMAAGVDVTSSIASMIVAGVDKNALNEGFALERSVSAQQALQAAGSNVSTDLLGLINTANIEAQTGLDSISARQAASLTTAELRGINNKGSDEEKKYALRELGIVPKFKEGMSTTEGIDALILSKVQTMAFGKEAAGLERMSDEQRKNLINNIKKGKSYSQLVKDSPEQQAALGGLYQGQNARETYEGLLAAYHGGANDPDAKAKVEALKKGELDPKSLMASRDAALTSASGQLTDAAKKATEGMENAAEALKGFAVVASALRASGYEGQATSAAAEAAATGKLSSNEKFEGSVDKFGRFVEDLTKIIQTADLSGRNSTPPAETERAAKNLIPKDTAKAGSAGRSKSR